MRLTLFLFFIATITLCQNTPIAAQGCAKFYGIAQSSSNLQQYKVVAIDSLNGNYISLNTVSTTTSGSTLSADGITANPDEQKLYYIQYSVSGSNTICSVKSISTVNGSLENAILIPSNIQQIPIALHYDCEQNKLFLVKRVATAPLQIDVQYINLLTGTITSILTAPIQVSDFGLRLTAYDVVHSECLFASTTAVYRVNTITGAVSTVILPEAIKSLEVNPFSNQIIVLSYSGTAYQYNTITATFTSIETGYATASPTDDVVSAYNPFSNRYWELSHNTATDTDIINYIDLNTGSIIASYPANDLRTFTAGYPCTAIPDFTFDAACAGAPLQFNDASWGAGDWLWNFGDPSSGDNNTATDPNPTHTFNTPGTYNVSLTVSGCLDTDSRSYSVVVNGAPAAELPDNVTTCSTTYTLNAGSSAGATYAWNTGATGSAITAATTGWYWVDVSANTCTVRDSVYVSLGTTANNAIWTETEQSICAQSVILNTGSISGTVYSWSSGETTPTITATQSGLYSVSITQADGCIVSDALNINLVPQPTVSLGNDSTVCIGNTLTLAAQVGNPSNSITYAWSSGETTAQIAVAQSGTYNVTVSNAGTCSASDAVQISVDTPTAVNFGSLPANICTITGETVLLDATTSTAQTYTWLPDNGNNAALTVSVAGTYSVTVTDAIGCSTSATATFQSACASVFMLPTAFSPNEDGTNDEFKPIAQFVENYTLSIFDRWGNLVFQNLNTAEGWNGKNTQGRAMPIGVYVWAATYTDQNGTAYDIKGNVTLVK